MRPIIEIDHLSKRYDSGTVALHGVSLDINQGEILALLGPNGAGKTTLISIICGLVVPTGGTVRVGGHDIRTDWRAARKMIGLVPQEILLEPFEKVIDCVRFTRGLYGEPPDEAYVEQLLRSLALWDKRDALTGVLAQDPRPHYQSDPQRIYGVRLYEFDVKWRCDGSAAIVETLERSS